MVTNIEAIKDEAKFFINEVREQFPVEKVYLFGSCAKGTADGFSDVDICFFLSDYGGKERIDVSVRLLRIARNYKAFFEPHVFEITDIECKNPFVTEILSTGQEL